MPHTDMKYEMLYALSVIDCCSPCECRYSPLVTKLAKIDWEMTNRRVASVRVDLTSQVNFHSEKAPVPA